MEISRKKITAITPHPNNVRQGDVGAISESLSVHGQYRPIIVQKSTGHILAGNHTWKAASVLGWKEIDAVELDVTDDEALRILLVDNRTNDLASYDRYALTELLEVLANTDAQLEGTGFDLDDLDGFLSDLDKADKPLTEFVEVDEKIPTAHRCPKCGYEWSGSSDK